MTGGFVMYRIQKQRLELWKRPGYIRDYILPMEIWIIMRIPINQPRISWNVTYGPYGFWPAHLEAKRSSSLPHITNPFEASKPMTIARWLTSCVRNFLVCVRRWVKCPPFWQMELLVLKCMRYLGIDFFFSFCFWIRVLFGFGDRNRF